MHTVGEYGTLKCDSILQEMNAGWEEGGGGHMSEKYAFTHALTCWAKSSASHHGIFSLERFEHLPIVALFMYLRRTQVSVRKTVDLSASCMEDTHRSDIFLE